MDYCYHFSSHVQKKLGQQKPQVRKLLHTFLFHQYIRDPILNSSIQQDLKQEQKQQSKLNKSLPVRDSIFHHNKWSNGIQLQATRFLWTCGGSHCGLPG